MRVKVGSGRNGPRRHWRRVASALALAVAIPPSVSPAGAQNAGGAGASSTISNDIAAAGDPIFAPAAGTTLTITGVISDATPPAPLGQVSMQGQGTLLLEGSNTYSGGTSVQSGTLQISGSGTLGASSGSTTVSGGTLDLGGTNQTQNGGLTLTSGGVQNGMLTSSGTFALQSGQMGAILTGTGGLTKTGAGAVNLVNLAGANAYTGATTVNGGTLDAFGTNSFSAASPTTVNAGGTLELGGGYQTINTVKLSGGTLAEGWLTGAMTSTGGSIIYINGSATLTTTAGTTVLGEPGSGYTGATMVSGGILTASAANGFSQYSATTITAGGTADLGGFAQAIAMVNLSGGTLQNGALTGSVTSTGGGMNGISGAASLLTTAGVTVLSGSNTYVGNTDVGAGTLTASAANAFSSASVMIINPGGTVDLGGFSQAINIVNLAGGTIQNGAIYEQGLPPWSPGPVILSQGGAISNIGGIAGLTVTAGTTTLSGSNTYLGGTDVSGGGVLTASAANAFSPGGETFTLIATHGTVDLGGFAQTINLVDLDGGTLQHGSLTGAVLSSGGAISGLSGSATVTTEDGVTTLSGVNSYTSATAVEGGTLTASTANAFSPASVTTISDGGAVNLGGLAQTIDTVNLSRGYLSGGGLYNGSLTGAVSSTDGYIDGLGGYATLTTTGGTTVLSTIWGPNTYTGATTVNGGVLTADNVNAFSPASVMTINIAGTVDLGAREQAINTVYLSGGAIGDGSLTSANGIVSTGGSVTSVGGSTALTANGGVTALLSNTYTGATTINSGATVIAFTASAFSANSALTINAGGAADLGGYNQTVASLSGSGTVTNSGAGAAVLTTGGDNTSTTFSGVISDGTGQTGLAKTGTGSLILTGANTYSGGTNVTAGVLGVGADRALGVGALTMQSGTTLQFEATGLTIANPIVFAAPAGVAAGGSSSGGAGGSTTGGAGGSTGGAGESLGGAGLSSSGGGGTIYTSDGAGLSLAIANPPTFQVVAGDPTIDTGPFTDTISGVISGSGALTKIGSGTLILSGANTYTGPTLVEAGTLAASAAGAFSPNSTVSVASGGKLDLGGYSNAIAGLAGAGSVTNGGGANATLTVDSTASATFSGVISDGPTHTLALVKSGSGALALTGVNTYSGGTDLAGGTLAIGSGAALGSGPLAMQDGTTLQLLSSTAIPNRIVLAAADPTIDTGSFSNTISGVISGPGALTKIGSGTLILAGANTYTGATDVQAGTLDVSGSVVSTVTVEQGATLIGTGSFGGLFANSGGTIAPGAVTPFSTLSASTASFAAGSFFAVNINPAGQNDKLVTTGATTISGGTVQVTLAPGTYTPQNKYTLITAGGGVSGTFASLSTNLNSFAFATPALSYDANDVYLGFAQTASFATVAQTPNQIATATALSALPVGSPLYNAIIGQTVPGALTAFNSLSGEIHPSAVGAVLDDTRLPREAVLDRLSTPYTSGPAPSGAQNVKTLMQATPAEAVSAWGQAFEFVGPSRGRRQRRDPLQRSRRLHPRRRRHALGPHPSRRRRRRHQREPRASRPRLLGQCRHDLCRPLRRRQRRRLAASRRRLLRL